MNKKLIKILCALFFLVLLNVGMFTFGSISITSFWISWAFIHIAFLIMVAVLVFSAAEQKILMFSYTEASVTIYYFIIELITGVVFAIQFIFFPVIAFVAQTVLLVAYGCAFFAVKKMNQHIGEAEEERQVNLHRYKNLLELLKSALQQVAYDASYKKTIEHAYDAMVGSPMRSVPAAVENENKIEELVADLKKAISEENEVDVKTVCTQIETEIEERNRKIRLK